MPQQFIELGEGYGDVYELLEIVKTNQDRFHQAFILTSTKEEKKFASLAIALKPVGESKFMPIYICREGIPYNEEQPSQRQKMFEESIKRLDRKAVVVEIKHSSIFSESKLFYQYLIGIMRLHHYIPALT
ncbi:methylthioribose kinase [Lysinibacillus sphaericus]|uniref:Methylthioribose kinase n=1 Tax=Lysinibacillus zambalensis TaxID=3160866 RepID=A0ABV1MNX1_9BACI|nr:methylthioribose kinase [Lysinibacillus sphaericus]MBG9455053.1 methylthioribose kinase [Lysinibacillus sphaericus]MBG9478597.1 methylthioribose kinase [Lysinibacillus sphaericus]MBG9592324.1 methylthioribose kinase [Lysinibacillus sphaericus]